MSKQSMKKEEPTLLKQHRQFSGWNNFYQHQSSVTGTIMKFSAYLPKETQKLTHCIIWLSGLTCTEENFIIKSGVQRYLSNTETMIICPDTSPRGLSLPNEHEHYYFGSSASFYVNALTDGYNQHYQMYDYIKKDLIQIIKQDFGIDCISIMGHSMGGHGALILGLRESKMFASVSAFAPIANPTQSLWGQTAFLGYLGPNKNIWTDYDATELIKNGYCRQDSILIDQGRADEFLEQQLLLTNLESAAQNRQSLELRYHDDFDHSYFFVSTFIADHIEFHRNHVKNY